MNRTIPRRAIRAGNLFAISVGLLLALAAAPGARATPFTAADNRVRQVFCDMASVAGQLTSTESRYTASGTCIELESPQKPDDKSTNTSEFPRVNESTQLFRANWTAQGSYNPVTKETWEKVTMPAPATDENAPIGRPYGNYETRMICATDPWLTGIGVNCTGKTVKATGNLGDAEALLRQLNWPATTPSKPAQLQALVAAHDRDARLQTRVAKVDKPAVNAGAIVLAPMPTIVEPRAGATYPPLTPLRVRVQPGRSAKDTAYRIEIQFQANFDWRDVTSVSTSAAAAQSPQGFRGWGTAATVGVYRLRAVGSAPQPGRPGEWVEFRIDGQPGVQVDVMDQVKPAPPSAAGAAQSAGARLAPKTPAAALTATPLDANRNKAAAVLLNPQPLPPQTAPGALTATPLPGGLPHVPSSLR